MRTPWRGMRRINDGAAAEDGKLVALDTKGRNPEGREEG
jgi:hypothetical protein